MMSGDRIAMLHYASPPVVGGVETTIYHHARTLADSGFKVSVVSGRGSAFDDRVHFHLLKEAGSRHPEVQSVGGELAQGKVSPAFDSLRDKLVERLSSVVENSQVLVAHNVLTLHKNLPLTAALAELARIYHFRMIAWCHDFAWLDDLYTHELHSGYPWQLLRQPWPGVRYVVVSQDRQSDLVGLLGLAPGQVRVVTPGVQAAEFLGLDPTTLRLVTELNLFSADPLMLLPARITRRKNIEFAIRVVACLVAHRPQAVLMVTGPPGPHNPKNAEYLASLRRLAANLGVADRVYFLYQHGSEVEPLRLSDTVMAGLYRVADLMIFPSLREGFGIPTLEAGLGRLPVFASDIPAVRESTAELATLFDPQGDPRRVAASIDDFLSRDRVYLLRRRVLENYTWRRVVENGMIPLLEELAS